ncbi:MAG TPA: hypothetical protein VIK14_14600, partial [Ignavibacteria bacterium]
LPFLDEVDDSHLIVSKDLQKIVSNNVGWKEERDLLYLTTLLLQCELFKKDRLEIKWAKNPNFLLSAIDEEKYLPNLVIYDWEYGTSFMVPEDSLSELLELLGSTFFFIYSAYAQNIPIHLLKNQLDKYAARFQVLLKGDSSYVTNSEEIIFEYIALRIDKNPTIKIGGMDVQFNSSGFLTDYKDILYLDNLLGRDAILKGLKQLKNVLSEETISSMLDNLNLKIYSSSNESIMTLDDIISNQKLFGQLKEISNNYAYKKLGLKKLKELIENGTVKVK